MKKLLRNAAWLLAFCGLAVSAYAQTCNPITITPTTPLREDFNSYSAGSSNSSIGGTELPQCWGSIVQSTTNYRPHIVTGSAYSYVSFSSNYALMMCGSSSYGGSPTFLVLPGVTNDLATLKMSFQYKKEGTPTLQLGYLTSPTDGSTFQVIKNLNSSSGTELIKFSDLSVSTTGTVYLAFKLTYSSSYYGAGVDDVVLEIDPDAPDCPAPTNLTVTPFEPIPSNPNKFSCYFSWTDATNAGSYKYAWVPQGSTVDWSSASQTTSVGQNAVTPLDPQTSYDLYVKIDNCTTGGGVAAVAGPLTITTPCLPTPLPYTENFEQLNAYTSTYMYGGTISNTYFPDCWTIVPNSYTSYGSTYDCTPHVYSTNGNKCLIIGSGNSSISGIAALPPISGSLADMQILFKDKRYSTTGTLYLGYYANGTFTSLTTVTDGSTDWTERSYNLGDLTGIANAPAGAQIAFKFSYSSNSSSYYALIDDITVRIAPACPEPTDLSVTPFESYTYQGNTKFRCDFSWSDATNAQSYRYIFVPQGSAVDWSSGAASTTPAVDGNEVAPLNPQTSYDLYVKIDNCTTGNGIAAVAGPLTITTPCLPSSLPYTEDFEQMDAYTYTYTSSGTISDTYFPACWTIVPNSYTSYGSTYDCTPHVYSTSGNKCLVIGSGNSSISGIAVLPPISGNLADMQILFKDKRYSTTGTLYLGYYANGTFTSLTEVTDGSTTAWKDRSYNLSDLTGIANAPAGAQIAFRFYYSYDSYSYYALIDDITVRLAPDCELPTALTATNITGSGATLGWTAGGNETAWEVAYGVAGFDLAQATTHNASTNSLPVNDLTGNTAYEFYVKAQCSGVTYWAGPYAFRTECNALTITENDYIDENFDSYSGVGSVYAVGTGDVKPYCWNYIFNGTDESHRPHLMGNSNSYHNSSNCLSICTGSSSYSEYGSPNYMIMPAVTNNLNELQLSFAVDVENAANTKLEVGYMTNPSVESSFVSVQEITCSSTPTTVPDIIFSDNVPGPVYVAFKATQIATSSYYGVTIDNVVLSLRPACSAPMNVAVNNVTATTADVNWQPTGEETSWLVKWTWGTNGKDSATVSSHPYTIPNLTENTAYTVMVKALCGQANESEYTAPVAFRTACNAITITENAPLMENFNSYSAGASSSIASVGTVEYPDCWKTIPGDNSSYRPHLYKGTSYNTGGSPCMAMTSGTSYGGKMNFVVLPGITNNLDELKLSCNVQMENASYGELSVGYLTDPADSTTFTLLQTIPSAASHTQHEISLSGATQGTTYLAFKWYCSDTYYSCTIDSVVVFLKSSCEMPTNVELANITSNSADVTWEPGYNETQWEVKWTWGTNSKDSIIVQNNPSYTIPNLTPNTAYTVCVRSICPATDEATDWTTPVNFTTECVPFVLTNSTIFRETFDNTNSIPSCWKTEGSASYPWKITTSGYNNSKGVVLSCSSNSTNDTSLLKTPVIDMTQVTGATLSFYWKYASTSTNGKIDVLVSTDGGMTFASTPLRENLRSNNTFKADTIDMTPYCGAGFDQVVVAFRGKVAYSYSYDMYVDNVVIEPILPCATPTAVVANALADSAAQVSWTAGGEETSWNLRYFATGGDTTTLLAVTNPYTVHGLSENTTYHFEVQADCGDVDGLSLWSDEATATTSCSSKALPYADNFNYNDGRVIATSYYDNTADMADCWDYVYTGTSAYYRPRLYKGTYSPVANDTSLMIISANSNTYGKGNILVCPVINADLQHVLVTFDYTQTNSSANDAYLQLGYITNLEDTSTFTALATLPYVYYDATPRSNHVELYTSDYLTQPVTNARLAFRWVNTSSSSYYATIDNVKVENEPACRKPVNITATNITHNSATITWAAQGNETAYLVSYQPQGGAVQEMYPTTNTAVLENLTGNTTYTVEIMADCGSDGQSVISDRYQFTTECDPFVVTMATPFVENFNSISSGIPACWNNEEGTTTDLSYRWNYNASGHEGNCVMFNSYYNSHKLTNFLKSQTLDLSQAVNGAELSFWLKYATATTDTTEGRFDLYLYTANDTVQLARNIRNVTEWTEYTYDISNYAGAGYDFVTLVFKGTSDYGSYNLYLDDVKVKALLPCHTPANVSVVGVSENSLTFGWDAVEGAVGYNVNYADSVGVAGQGLMDTTSVPSYTFTHLGLDTTIYIYVQADCGATDGLSEWIAVAVSGTTPACAAITVTEEMPYIEDFTNVPAGTSTTNSATAGFPDCWTRVYQVLSSSYDYTPHVYTGSYAPAASNNALLLGASTSYGNPAYVALPQFTNPMADLALSFTTAMSSATSGTLKVGYMMNPSAANSFVELETIPNNDYSNSATRSVAHTIYLRDYQSIPEGAFIAFKWSSPGSTYYCAIDDIQMFIAPTCLAPTAVTFNNVSGNSAEVTWSPRYEETAWFYYYGLAGFDPRPESGEYIGVGYVNADMLPLTLEGLADKTTYDFYLVSDCSHELSTMSEAFSFTTPCAAYSVPWSENFDSYTVTSGNYFSNRTLPDCWSYNGFASYTPGVYNGTTYLVTGDGNALGLTGTSSSSYVTMMPAFDYNLRELQISFKYAQESLSSDHILSIGYVTDVNDQATFVALDTMPVTGISEGTFYDYQVVFKAYGNNFPDNARIAFKYDYQGISTYIVCIDDIVVDLAPACIAPANVAVSNITENSATITWRPRDMETQWEVACVPQGTTPTEGTVTQVDTLVVSGLTENTTYDVYVRALCSETAQSEWTAPYSFTTLCSPLALPYSEDFESYYASTVIYTTNADTLAKWQVPACWEAPSTTYLYYSTTYHTTAHVYREQVAAGNNTQVLVMQPGLANYAILPAFTDLSNAEIVFKITMDLYQSDESVSFGYMFNDHFTSLIEIPYSTLNEGWKQYEYMLDQFTIPAGAHLAFSCNDIEDYMGYFCAIDDIVIREIPNCLMPGDVTVSQIAADSAVVTWTARNQEAQWEVTYTPVEEENMQRFLTDTNTVTLPNLSGATTYIVKVRSFCTVSDTSDWSYTIFATPCGIFTLPYSEDFESYNASTSLYSDDEPDPNWEIPTCWETNETYIEDYDYEWDDEEWEYVYVYYDLYTTAHIYNGTSYVPSGTNKQLIMGGNDDDEDSYVVLPEFDDLSNAQISFKTAMYSTSYGELSLGYMLNDNFTEIAIVPSNSYSSYVTHTYDLDTITIPAGARLSFKWDSEYDYYYYTCAIDDIIVREIPTCFTPTTVLTGNAGTDTVQLAWLPAHGETAWNIEYGEAGFEQGTGTTIAVADTNAAVIYTLRNLTASMHYDLYIQGNCGEGDLGDWNGPFTFTTQCETFALPFSEDFNSLTTGIPDCWDNSEGTTTNDSYRWNYYETGYAGHGLRFNSWSNSSGKTNMLKTPAISIPDGLRVELEFYYKNPTGGDFSVYVSTDGGATYLDNAIATDLTGQTAWTSRTFELTQFAGNDVVIVFMGTSNYGSGDAYIYLDNVELRYLPDCETPTDVMVENITASTAAISWTSADSTAAWNVTYYDVVDSITATVTANEPTITLQNLTASTTYNFTVVAVCDGVTYPTDEYSFTTECEPYTITEAAPYTEDFTDYTASSSYSSAGVMPSCWNRIYTGSSSAYASHVFKNASYTPTANNNAISIVAYKNSTLYGQENYIILPAFTNPLADLKIEFATAMSSSDGKLSIGFITDPNDADSYSSFENIPTNLYSGSARYTSHEIYVYDYLEDYDIPEGARLAFKWKNDQSSSLSIVAIDDIVVSLYQLYDTVSHVACDVYVDGEGNRYEETTSVIETEADGEHIYNHVTYYEINHSVNVELAETACDSFVWDDTTIYTTGQYVKYYTTTENCDSIVTLNVTINNHAEVEFSDSACLTYTWNNRTFTESGDYVDTLATVENCDSIVTLHLTILHGTYEEFTDQTCDTSYTWNWRGVDAVYYGSGVYTRYATGDNGCEDTAVLNVTFYTPVTTNIVAQICEGETYSLYNFNATEAGTYTQTGLQTVNGCDSTVILTLTVGEQAETSVAAVICEGEDYTENGFNILQPAPGIVLDTLTLIREGSCDSVVYLTLTVNAKTYYTDIQEACDSFTWIDGETYRTSINTPTVILRNAAGCDSIVTLDLTIYNSVSTDDYQVACESYVWNNETYTESGDYVDTLATINGCDSIVTLHLTINRITYGTDVQRACNTFTWIDGQTYTQSTNTPTWTLTNAAGCDSIVTLDLTINRSVMGRDSITTCDSYTWIDGLTYTESTYGEHVYFLTSVEGCDSTAVLYLTINHSYYDTTRVEACDSYTWTNGDGRTYRSSREVTYALTTAAGCDSIMVLELTINYTDYTTDIQEACDSFTWIDGQTYTQSTNTPTWTLTSSHGCDSIVTLDLTIHNSVTTTLNESACGSYTWALTGETYTETGDHSVTLTSMYGCDSTVVLHVVVYEMPVIEITGQTHIHEGESTTLSVTEGEGWNYSWTTGDRVPEITVTPAATTTYTVIVSNGSCIANASVTVEVSVGLNNYVATIDRLYPNPADEYCTIEAANMQTIQVFNMNGQLVNSYRVDNANSYRIETTTYAPGVYFVKVITTENKVITAKFVVKH